MYCDANAQHLAHPTQKASFLGKYMCTKAHVFGHTVLYQTAPQGTEEEQGSPCGRSRKPSRWRQAGVQDGAQLQPGPCMGWCIWPNPRQRVSIWINTILASSKRSREKKRHWDGAEQVRPCSGLPTKRRLTQVCALALIPPTRGPQLHASTVQVTIAPI